jgi:hypothetical protein
MGVAGLNLEDERTAEPPVGNRPLTSRSAIRLNGRVRQPAFSRPTWVWRPTTALEGVWGRAR